ncbi:MAG: hypothetical protein J0M37_14070 [Ignavibacteria bacterium]|nr:hypothetical protein [Ignavibacteria bacterium]
MEKIKNILLKSCLSFFLFLFICTLSKCTKDDSLKERELNLKEKELNIREKELVEKENTTDKVERDNKSSKEENQNKRKLQYLFSSNGGLVGYFNDGTVVGCPRCDLTRENVKNLYKLKSNGSFTVNIDGTLNVKGSSKVDPKSEDGWVMINYKWLVEVE